jgi:hypothetical protein
MESVCDERLCYFNLTGRGGHNKFTISKSLHNDVVWSKGHEDFPRPARASRVGGHRLARNGSPNVSRIGSSVRPGIIPPSVSVVSPPNGVPGRLAIFSTFNMADKS